MTFTANVRLLVDVCRLPFAVLSSCASASRTPESSRSHFSWTGLFSESLQCPPVPFREAPRYNFPAKCNALIHFWPAKWSHYIKSYGFYK